MNQTNQNYVPQLKIPSHLPQTAPALLRRLQFLFVTLALLGIFAMFGPVSAVQAQSPHGNYTATTDACAVCHRAHTAGSSTLLNSSAQNNDFCLSCHDGAAAVAVSTHGNSDFAGKAEGTFTLLCVQCHDPHGNYTNIQNIREDVFLQGSNLTGPVQFTAYTGANSFDDGASAVSNRVCVTCHANPANPGAPMTNHAGATGHGGGWDFTAQDCTGCHAHEGDANPATVDGFMPTGGCTQCHALPQDNGDNIPVGGRRAVVNEFGYTSHHIQGPVQDSDCKVCHSLSNHQQGQIVLNNVDIPGSTIAYSGADPAVLEDFCLACHDANGAGGAAPFSDGLMPPVVDSSMWIEATHGNIATCYDCHDNGHGSIKASLLAPFNATIDTSVPGDPLRQQEGFCYTCHGPGGPAAIDIQAEFGLASHHNVSSLDQVDGSKVECTNCHNPHTVKPSNKISDPDALDQLWAGTGYSFCLACHDGASPVDVSFPPAASGTGYNKSTYSGAHSLSLGTDSCRTCHGEHGENFSSLLPAQYATNDYNPYTTGDYQMCWSCHDENLVIGPNKNNAAINAFGDLHYKHVVGEDAPCIACHDTHAPHDPGEQGLISFDTAFQNGFDIQYIGGRDSSTAFWQNANQTQGSCYIACHGKDHKPKNYTRYEAQTVTACTGCHAAAQDNGDGLPAGGRRAVVDEFGNTSHHIQGPVQDADCQVCHAESNVNLHQDGYLQMIDADTGATTTESAPGAYRQPTAAADLNNLTSFCQSCHDADAANGNTAPFSDGLTPPVVSLHANTDFNGGAEANFEVACVQCHQGHGSSNRSIIKSNVQVSGSTTAGPIVFTALTGVNSFDEGDADPTDDICTACHASTANPGYPMTNHTGGANHLGAADYSGLTCTTCHPHTADDQAATRDGFMPSAGCTGCHAIAQDNGDGLPAGGRRAVVDEFGNTSHHIQGQAQDSDCQTCHNETNTHQDGFLQLTNADTGAIYTESVSGAYRQPTTTGDLNNLTSFCQSCHDTDGANGNTAPFSDGLTPPIASVHSNVDFAGGVEANFAVACVQCHNSHGSSNLSNIRPLVLVDPPNGITTGPVVLTALTGVDSFDENDGGNDADDLCATCHVNTGNPGYPMTNHSGGENHAGGANFAGLDCTTCHPHTQDSVSATQDGFMADGTCTGCHSAPMGSRRAIVDEFGNTSHHVQGPVQDSDCVACHDLQQHQSGQVRLINVDNPTNVIVLTGDPATDPIEAAKLETFCLACHDANGANGAAPFSDGLMPPVIDNTAMNQTPHGNLQTCFDCHSNGHGTNNTSLLQFQYATNDYNPYIAGDYQMCWKCHNQNSVVGPDKKNRAVNAFDDLHWKHVVGEDTPCAFCHSPHNPHDPGESGLVDFTFALQNGYDIQMIDGYNASTAYWVNGNSGSCYLACHGKDHTPKSYNRNPIITTMWEEIKTAVFELFMPFISRNSAGQPRQSSAPAGIHPPVVPAADTVSAAVQAPETSSAANADQTVYLPLVLKIAR